MSSLACMQLIPASAGSGKTYRLKEQLKEWVCAESPQVAANRIVAVTFTEAAAAELRQRIRGTLLKAGRLADAADLEDAYVSTIHGFGLRLLQENTFDLGRGLKLRLLTEDERKLLMRRALGIAELKATAGITRDLAAFGYRYNHSSGASAEDEYRDDLRKMIDYLQAIGAEAESQIGGGREWIANCYGPPSDEAPDAMAARLQSAATRLLETYPQSLATTHGNNKTAIREFSADYENLCRARDGSGLDWDWDLWVGLCNLRLSRRGCEVPADYEALASSVMEAASAIHRHPGPLEQGQRHFESLLRTAGAAINHYEALKRDAGLLDYADMVAGAYEALRHEGIAKRLRSELDCMVVDEFQDTNPLQFGLLWQLMRQGLPSVVVGDVKQSIMGFQGADPRLFKTLLEHFPDAAEPLDRNWRSQPALLEVINSVSARLFEDYQPLEPRGGVSELPALHVLQFPDIAHCKDDPYRSARVAEALAAKIDDPGLEIIDRHSGAKRRLRGGDCAVLCPTHGMLARYARALREQGLNVRLQQSGWLESSEVQLALQALSLVANPGDLHARLYLSVTDFGSLDLETALKRLVAGEDLEDPVLDKLDALSQRIANQRLDDVVAEVLHATGFFDLVAHRSDARQARANLVRLQGVAKEFVDAQPESLLAAGIHGYGIPQFIAWLNQAADSDDTMPAADAVDEDAVELVTWHASKGREWPVVAVCGLNQSIKADLPELALDYPEFDDLDALIQRAQIRLSPAFASKPAGERFLKPLSDARRDQVLREIYVAITRPRDQLVLEWPEFAADPDKSTRASAFAEAIGISVKSDGIELEGGEHLPAQVDRIEPPSVPDENSSEGPSQGTGFSRLAIASRALPGDQVPDARQPSLHQEDVTPGANVTGSEDTVGFERIAYGEALDLPSGPGSFAIGSFVHRFFELDDDRCRAMDLLREEAERLWPQADSGAICDALRSQRQAFEQALKDSLGADGIEREVPMIGLDEKGSVINGVIDCLASADEARWVIDHKTDKGGKESDLWAQHLPQLRAYASLFTDHPCAGVALNIVRQGVLLVASTEHLR
ncbi:UvrD-helicase domain-containing protein [Algiphilus sp.]|uniref:UvrD-helicase domain-containing protein n=1 Tax=Algiphilus sp. TaxID=1872431 RepID=UPI003BAD7126